MGRLGLVLAIVVVVIIAGGLAYYLVSKGGLGGAGGVVKGAVNITGIELYVDPREVTEAKTPVEVHVGVNNSFPVSVKVKSGKLSLLINGLKLAEITVPSQEIRRGHNVVVLNAVIDNMLIDELWYHHLSRGEKSNMTLQGSLVFDTPIGGIEVPVSYSKPIETHMFPVEQELNREYDLGVMGKVVVEKVRVDLAGITPSETKLRVYLTIRNELKAIPLYVSGLVFQLKLSDGTILGRGEQEGVKSIAPGETDTLVFNVVLDNSKIPILWYKHVRNREDTKIIVEAWLKVEIAGKTIELFKEHPLTATIEFKTSMFKYKG